MVLLKTIAEGDNSQFETVAKDHYWTTWEINGFEARLPDSFVLMIKEMKGKPLGIALEEEGLIGKGIAPLLEEGLLVAPAKEIPSQLPGSYANDYDSLVTCLKEQMGYPLVQAEEAAKYVTEKYASEILENKIKYALSYLGS